VKGAGCAVLVCLLTAAVPAAQSPPACTGDDCAPPREQIASAASAIARDKGVFVGALRQLIQALPGAYGDDAARVTSSIEEMARTLGRWDRSIATYRALVLDAAGRTPDGHLALAGVYLERGRIDDAMHEASTAAGIDPERPEAYMAQALAYDRLERHADAAAAFEKAATLRGAGVGALYGQAQQLLAEGDEARATAALRAFDTLATSIEHGARSGRPAAPAPFVRAGLLRQPAGVSVIFPPARYARGLILVENGSLDAAVSELRSAATTDPMMAADVRESRDVQLGAAALRNGDPASAIRHLTDAARMRPDRAERRRLLGLALAAGRQPERSIEELTAATARDPDDDRAASALAEVLIRANRGPEAERVLRRELEAVPGSGIALYQLATLLAAAGRTGEAIPLMERATASAPVIGQDYLYDTLATLYLRDANLSGALGAYRRRVAVDPNLSDAHRKVAQIYLELGRHEEASAEFAAALRLDPSNGEAQAGLAQVHFRRGEYEAAAQAARRALALNHTHLAAQYTLGASLLRLGRTSEGTEALDVFRRLQEAAQAAADREWELKLRRQAAQPDR